jgi:hypothetical protein
MSTTTQIGHSLTPRRRTLRQYSRRAIVWECGDCLHSQAFERKCMPDVS